MNTLPTYLEQGLLPDIIDDSNANDVFIGYAKYSGNSYPNIFAIKRITKVVYAAGVEETITRYPNGVLDFGYNWYNRANYDYRIKNDQVRDGQGFHYSVPAVQDVRNIANTGWRVALKQDFLDLFANIGMSPEEIAAADSGTFVGSGNKGADLKKVGSPYWNASEGITNTDLYGWGAVGASWKKMQGTPLQADFGDITMILTPERVGMFQINPTLRLSYSSNGVQIHPNINDYGSVKLIKEDDVDPGYYRGCDGQLYETCLINTQVWIVGYLRETLYRDGSPIVEIDKARVPADWQTGSYRTIY